MRQMIALVVLLWAAGSASAAVLSQTTTTWYLPHYPLVLTSYVNPAITVGPGIEARLFMPSMTAGDQITVPANQNVWPHAGAAKLTERLTNGVADGVMLSMSMSSTYRSEYEMVIDHLNAADFGGHTITAYQFDILSLLHAAPQDVVVSRLTIHGNPASSVPEPSSFLLAALACCWPWRRR